MVSVIDWPSAAMPCVQYQGCTLLYIMRVKESQKKKKWGLDHEAEYSSNLLSNNPSSTYASSKQLRASNSSTLESEPDLDMSELQDLDALITEYVRTLSAILIVVLMANFL